MTEEIKTRIHELAVRQIVADFQSIKEKCIGESIYGFGLGLVEDITGFFSAANTVESLKRKLLEEDDKDDISSFWLISEWGYEGTDDNTLYEFLATFIFNIEDGKYESAVKDYEEVLTNALKTCDEQGVFGKGQERENIIVYLHYADAANEDLDDISSEQINSTASHQLFKERWNSEKDNLTKVIQRKIDEL